MIRINCPKCFRSNRGEIRVRYGENRFAKWFKGDCSRCDYRLMLKDYEFDLIQPDSPFFEAIYKFNPEREEEKKVKEKEFVEQQRLAKLERKYHDKYIRTTGGISSRSKPWELKKLKQIVLKGK